MNVLAKRISLSLSLLAIGAMGMVAYESGAAGRLAGRPSVVVTVNLQAVMDKLDQRANAEASLQKIVGDMKAEDDKRTGEIKPLQEQLKGLENQPDTQEKRDLQEKFAMAMLDYQAWTRVIKSKIDIEKSLLLQNLYQTIKAEVKNMSSAEGYDIVLVDDSQGELTLDPDSRIARESQLRQQVAARRMLYANPDVDITNDLITRMNNAFKSGAKPVASPPKNNGGKP